jgi:hypothetical protein
MTTPLGADVVGSLFLQVQAAACAGTPLTKTAAETLLRAAGLSRADARRVLEAGVRGYWTEVQGPPASRGGRPPRLLLPSAPGDPAADPRPGRDGETPVDTRARLLEVARTLGFRRCEFRPGQVIPDGEQYWRRFVTTAPLDDVMATLDALSIGTPGAVRR